MTIQEYLDDLLNNQLPEIKYRYRKSVVEDIRNRMCSLLSRWDDEVFRRTVLFVTDEEALFYQPEAPEDVKRFVAAAIRNSILEIAASDNCDQLKMPACLPDDKIKEITSKAISYFKSCDFEKMQEEVKDWEYTDVYADAIRKYPLAWEILQKAAAADREEIFEKLPVQKAEATMEKLQDHKAATEKTFYKKVVCDGYSLEFDDFLKEELANAVSGDLSIFYVDCFKGLTRNFEKVLNVLQILLENDKAFVTCNYYISNGRIEKRRRILRAFHSDRDMFENVRNLKGIPVFFKKVLEGLDF